MSGGPQERTWTDPPYLIVHQLDHGALESFCTPCTRASKYWSPRLEVSCHKDAESKSLSCKSRWLRAPATNFFKFRQICFRFIFLRQSILEIAGARETGSS